MKVTFPAEKPFLRLAMGRTFALPDSEVAVWKKRNAVVCLLCQGTPSRLWFTGWIVRLGGVGFLPNCLLLSCCKRRV